MAKFIISMTAERRNKSTFNISGIANGEVVASIDDWDDLSEDDRIVVMSDRIESARERMREILSKSIDMNDSHSSNVSINSIFQVSGDNPSDKWKTPNDN